MKTSKVSVMRIATLGILWCLAQAGPARAGESIAFDLPADQLCAEALTYSVGDLSLTSQSPWCVASTAGGLTDALIVFDGALRARMPQPPEFYGYFREAQADVVFNLPGPPPAGVEVAAATVIQHLMVVWIFDQDGVSIFPIGDPIAFYQPAPPPYLAGTIAGKVQYGAPVEVTVRMTTDTHMLVVTQSGRPIAATTLKKIFRHPDAMSYETLLQIRGDVPAGTVWSFGGGAFQGVKSDAEVIIGSEPSAATAIGAIDRVGSEVRVYPR